MAGQVALVQEESKERAALGNLLAQHGYAVTQITPQQLLSNAVQIDADCVLLEYCPDNQTCLELIHSIRRQPAFELVPLIVLAREVARHELTKALSAGANAYLLQPADEAELLAYLNAQLRMRQALRDQLAEAAHQKVQLSRMHADLVLGQQVQSSMLPPSRLRSMNFVLETRLIPGGDLSGDYFDYKLITPEHLALFLADVSGHGIASALLAGRLKAMFERNQDISSSPRQFLESLNQEIINLGEHYHIATAVCVHVDAKASVFKYASAGHRTMYWLDRETGASLSLPASGPALGMFDEFEINEVTRGFTPGRNRLTAFTDGLVEFRRLDGSWVVEQDFVDRVLRPNYANPIEDFVSALVHASSELAGTDKWEDDVSLFALDF